MNRRLKYVPMLCVCLIGMLVSCGTVKRASGLSGNKAVVEEKDPLIRLFLFGSASDEGKR